MIKVPKRPEEPQIIKTLQLDASIPMFCNRFLRASFAAIRFVWKYLVSLDSAELCLVRRLSAPLAFLESNCFFLPHLFGLRRAHWNCGALFVENFVMGIRDRRYQSHSQCSCLGSSFRLGISGVPGSGLAVVGCRWFLP